jgi:hypothetical protein
MDKRTRSGVPKVERLQFARLRTVHSLGDDRARMVHERAAEIEPTEVLCIGEVPDLSECCILLSDPYHLPAAYFGLSFRDYKDHDESGPDDDGLYITAAEHRDNRLGRLEASQLELLRQKMRGWWTRVVIPPRE